MDGEIRLCKQQPDDNDQMKCQQRTPRAMKPQQSDTDCKIRQGQRDPFHETWVMIVFRAPASFKDSETDSASSGLTKAIMLPPRPPPDIFAPVAPASRAASTSRSNSGEETVSFCRRAWFSSMSSPSISLLPASMARRAVKAISPILSNTVSQRALSFIHKRRTSATESFVGAEIPVSPMTIVNGCPTVNVSTPPPPPPPPPQGGGGGKKK